MRRNNLRCAHHIKSGILSKNIKEHFLENVWRLIDGFDLKKIHSRKYVAQLNLIINFLMKFLYFLHFFIPSKKHDVRSASSFQNSILALKLLTTYSNNLPYNRILCFNFFYSHKSCKLYTFIATKKSTYIR